MSTFDDRELCVTILRHLDENPEGMDTLEGIARFWVLRQMIHDNVKEVEKAIKSLVDGHYIKERVLRNSSGEMVERYYQLNVSRMKSIREFLGTTESDH